MGISRYHENQGWSLSLDEPIFPPLVPDSLISKKGKSEKRKYKAQIMELEAFLSNFKVR